MTKNKKLLRWLGENCKDIGSTYYGEIRGILLKDGMSEKKFINTMFDYDRQANAMYIHLSDDKVAHTINNGNYMNIDYSKNYEKIVGIELLGLDDWINGHLAQFRNKKK